MAVGVKATAARRSTVANGPSKLLNQYCVSICSRAERFQETFWTTRLVAFPNALQPHTSLLAIRNCLPKSNALHLHGRLCSLSIGSHISTQCSQCSLRLHTEGFTAHLNQAHSFEIIPLLDLLIKFFVFVQEFAARNLLERK